jgi:hypothetical protein
LFSEINGFWHLSPIGSARLCLAVIGARGCTPCPSQCHSAWHIPKRVAEAPGRVQVGLGSVERRVGPLTPTAQNFKFLGFWHLSPIGSARLCLAVIGARGCTPCPSQCHSARHIPKRVAEAPGRVHTALGSVEGRVGPLTPTAQNFKKFGVLAPVADWQRAAVFGRHWCPRLHTVPVAVSQCLAHSQARCGGTGASAGWTGQRGAARGASDADCAEFQFFGVLAPVADWSLNSFLSIWQFLCYTIHLDL